MGFLFFRHYLFNGFLNWDPVNAFFFVDDAKGCELVIFPIPEHRQLLGNGLEDVFVYHFFSDG